MTREQQRKFWAALGDIARQVKWPVNNQWGYLHKDDWRFIFCAALMQEQRVAAGINGGQVVLGLRLRDIFAGLSPEDAKRRASDLIELVTAFGARNSVVWSDPEEAAWREQYEKETA